MKVNKQIATLVLTGVLAAGSALPAFAAVLFLQGYRFQP